MAKAKLAKYLWVEKFRPESVNDILLPNSILKLFKRFVRDKEIPHLLLHSNSPGVGKTTIAKAICSDINARFKYINTSDENGIDTLRTKITKFAISKNIYGNQPKVLILDEFDGATDILQRALRSPLEELADHCRVILTCNYKTKIIPAIQSRCQPVDFNMTLPAIKQEMMPKITARVGSILKYEKVTFDKTILGQVIDAFYPDIRKTLNILQQYSKQTNGVIDDGIFNFETVESKFFDMILNKDFNNARKYVIESNHNIDELYRELYDNLLPKIQNQQTMAEILIIIADYMHKSVTAFDKEVNFAACMMEIIGTL